MEEDYKKNISNFYNRCAKVYEERTRNYLKKYIIEDAILFMANLPGRKILDLGSGPGRDSLFFKERGLNPLCLDISSQMVELCRRKGLNAIVGDLEKLDFKDGTFDGVWAYTSLLHMPKSHFKPTLLQIKRILKEKGVLYLGMKE